MDCASVKETGAVTNINKITKVISLYSRSQLVQILQQVIDLFLVESLSERRHDSAAADNRLAYLLVGRRRAARKILAMEETGEFGWMFDELQVLGVVARAAVSLVDQRAARFRRGES